MNDSTFTARFFFKIHANENVDEIGYLKEK